jgi:hypothetical protein
VTRRKQEPTGSVTCSFCRKSQKQLKKLVAGPGVYICDECINLCNDIIEEECPPAYVQLPFSIPATAFPNGAEIGESLFLLGSDGDGKVERLSARLLARETGEGGLEHLQLKVAGELAARFVRLTVSGRPVTMGRVLKPSPADEPEVPVVEKPTVTSLQEPDPT